MSDLLRIAVFLPAMGAVAIALLAPRRAEAEQAASRWIALATAMVTLVLSLFLVAKFPAGGDEFAVSETALWFRRHGGQVDIRFSLGLDGLSLWLFGLTALLMILAIAVSWKAVSRYCPGLLCPAADPANWHDGRVLRPGYHPVLRVL